MIFDLIIATNSGKNIIRVLSEDTNVFVLLTGMLDVSGGGGVQGADGAVGYDNAWPQCLQ